MGDSYRLQNPHQDGPPDSMNGAAAGSPLATEAAAHHEHKKLPGRYCYSGAGRYLNRWVLRCKVTLTILWERPLLVAASLLVFGALCSAGLAAVLTAAALDVASTKDLAQHGIGSQVAASLKQALKTSCVGAELLGAVVVQMPNCSSLDTAWDSITTDIMSRVDPAVVQQLELDVAAVIWKAFPPFGPGLEFLYGRDLLKEPDDRPGVLYSLRERRTLIMGPYTCKAGFKCAFTVTPLFLPAPSAEYDWGCGFQPYNCTDLCWDPVHKTKYWGQVSTMLNLDPFFSRTDERLVMLAGRGYDYKLWQANTSFSNPYVLFANTTADLKDPVVQEIQIENLVWYLEIAPEAGWVPRWRAPCLAAVVVGAALVSLLVLWLLVSKEQHNRLLRAMLPRKVIQQLQNGEQAIAEHFDSVTILFSDIVGYTTVASQLTPFEVVTLLNELFSVFDELTQRNGVYKVETIGDALMCVAGCPVPEDAALNAKRIARMALDMVNAVQQFRPSLEGVQGVQIRVGIHSGPIVAGVVGKKMPRYCLFGDTVNTCSRMESTSEPMKIQVSASTAALLRSLPGDDVLLEPRGLIAIKGKGSLETFFLKEAHPASIVSARSDSVTMIVSRPVRSVTVIRQQSRSHRSLRAGTPTRSLLELFSQATTGGGGGWTAGGGSSSCGSGGGGGECRGDDAGGSGSSRRVLAGRGGMSTKAAAVVGGVSISATLEPAAASASASPQSSPQQTSEQLTMP